MQEKSIQCFEIFENFYDLISIYNILSARFCNLNEEMFNGYVVTVNSTS